MSTPGLFEWHQDSRIRGLSQVPNKVAWIEEESNHLIIKKADGTVLEIYPEGRAPVSHAASHNFGGTDALAGQSIAGLRAVDSPTFAAVTSKLNVHSGNEATIANGYASSTGRLWINYGGAGETTPITEYNFGSGRSDNAYGALKGLSFIKSGGTNQQLLLADGTTDPKTRGVESTGLYAWPSPCISIASPTTFTVTAVSGQVVDTTTTPGAQVVTPVAYPGAVGITATYLATAPTTYVLVSAAGALVQQTTIPTAQQRRENIFLGILVHSAFTAITAIDVQPDICTNPISQMRELWGAIRYVNDGVMPYANGANLSINISGGHFHGLGLNWASNTRDPMIRNVGPYVAPNFKYRLRAGGTLSIVSVVDPTHWDNAGVLTVLAGGVNTSTNQRINISPAGEIVIQYGQTVYASLNDAVANANTETFVTAPGVAENLQLIGTLSVRKGATNLSLLTDAKFLTASKFGELSSGSAGATTATFQSIYDNSVVPQITTNTTNGALTVKPPSGGDDSLSQIVVMSGASVELFRVNGLGQVFAASYTLSGAISQGANVRLTSGGKGQFSALSVQGIANTYLTRIDPSGNVIGSGIRDDGTTINAERRIVAPKIVASLGASDTLAAGSYWSLVDADPVATKGWTGQLSANGSLHLWGLFGGTWGITPIVTLGSGNLSLFGMDLRPDPVYVSNATIYGADVVTKGAANFAFSLAKDGSWAGINSTGTVELSVSGGRKLNIKSDRVEIELAVPLYQGGSERISSGGVVTGSSLKGTDLSAHVGKSLVVGSGGSVAPDNARGAMVSFASIPSVSVITTVPYVTTFPDVGYIGSFSQPANSLTAHRVIEIEGGFRASGGEVLCTLAVGIGAGGAVFDIPVTTSGAYVRFSIQLGVSTVGSGGTVSIVGVTTTGTTGGDRTFGVTSVAVDTTEVNTLAVTLSGTGTFSVSSRTLTIRG